CQGLNPDLTYGSGRSSQQKSPPVYRAGFLLSKQRLGACSPHLTPASAFNLFAGEEIAANVFRGEVALAVNTVGARLALYFADLDVAKRFGLRVVQCQQRLISGSRQADSGD